MKWYINKINLLLIFVEIINKYMSLPLNSTKLTNEWINPGFIFDRVCFVLQPGGVLDTYVKQYHINKQINNKKLGSLRGEREELGSLPLLYLTERFKVKCINGEKKYTYKSYKCKPIDYINISTEKKFSLYLTVSHYVYEVSSNYPNYQLRTSFDWIITPNLPFSINKYNSINPQQEKKEKESNRLDKNRLDKNRLDKNRLDKTVIFGSSFLKRTWKEDLKI